MTSSPFFRKSALVLLSLAFLAAWFYLTRGLFLTALRLRPLVEAGDPSAWLLTALALPWAAFLAQGLFYIPRRRLGPPVFIHPADPAGPLLFLPLPWRRTEPQVGPALDLICSPGDREILLARARDRFRQPLSARLALLLQARTPLDRLLNQPIEGGWPLISPLARLISLLLEPPRQFLRCWGYLFFQLWRAWDEPGPVDQLTIYKQTLAYDLIFRAGAGASPDDLRRIWGDLARIYDHPGYGYDLGQPAENDLDRSRAVSPEAEKSDPPWLNPRYRGAYLDLPVTWPAGSVEELYDQGPEEDPARFYPPELGREVELAARLTAERRRLAQALSAGRDEGLIRLDGRLSPAWELEYTIWDLDDRLWQEKKRVAAHHRRCRSSHLAAARRRGGGWPELLRAALARLFLAERFNPDWRDEALTALLAAEEAVTQDSAEKPNLPWPESGPEPELKVKVPLAPEAPPRVYSAAEKLHVGFGRTLLALIILGLFFWQGGLATRSHLTIYNGLARELLVTVDGRRLKLAPFGRAEALVWPQRACQVKTRTLEGRLLESFSQRVAAGNPGREVYNIAGAAPLMEWWSPPGPTAPPERFLGRPRWLSTQAGVLFPNPADQEAGRAVLLLSGYGDDPPGDILEAFEDEKDRDELIRLHARWDEPDSTWFWHWQILLIDRPDWIPTLMDRVESEPDFLVKGLTRFD